MSSEFHDQQIDQALTKAAELIGSLKTEITRLRDASALSIGAVQQFLPYPLAAAIRSGNYSAASLEAERVRSLPIVEKNEEIARNNLRIKQALEELLNRAGVPSSVRKGCLGHGRNAKAYSGGWSDSLNSIPVTHGWDQVLAELPRVISQIDERERKEKWAQEERTRSQEADRQRIEAAASLLVLRAKYGLSDTANVLEELLGRNKYLRLAYWLERNRGDWSDGCDYARTGIDGFAPLESSTDSEIHSEIKRLCEDFDDGRSFRDCKWNYGRLYEMAAQQDPVLIEDARKLIAMKAGEEE